jgi:hypothetical protein
MNLTQIAGFDGSASHSHDNFQRPYRIETAPFPAKNSG